jgi:glucosamine--fructose-6-phosphate aminotransferase (isomerizing)
MCGIVGYVGRQPVVGLLIDGLKRLEYRGYDSAGVAVHTRGGGGEDARHIAVVRAVGKIRNLEKRLESETVPGDVGIGHTRWATHGKPSEENAHPHAVDGVVVVHNGIIENHMELREHLLGAGRRFASETDTEIVSHLIALHLKGGATSLLEATRHALHEVRGAYAIAVLWDGAPDEIVVARNHSPLVLGLGDGEQFVASDVMAILEHTNRMVFLHDRDMAVLRRGGVLIETVDGAQVERPERVIKWSPVMAEKGGHKHFMHKEIHEQPRAVTDTIRGRAYLNAGDVSFESFDLDGRIAEGRPVRRLCIVACGTSHNAGMAGRYMIESLAGVPVDVELASEFRYRDPVIDGDTVVVGISQSGETADTLGAIREAQRRGCHVVSICNVVDSTIARESNDVIYTHAGPEIGVASTKAFTTQLVVLYMLGVKLGRLLGRLDAKQGRTLLQGLIEIPYLMEEMLHDEGHVREVAARYHAARNFLFLGRGANYPIAIEGALKLKELSYIHAEGYAAGEMKHGPIALIDEDMPTVVVAPEDAVYEKVLSNIQEVKARGGPVIALVNIGDEKLRGIADDVITFPRVAPLLLPLLTVLPLQLFAYHIADMRGTDVDQPRNLAKSVTVE